MKIAMRCADLAASRAFYEDVLQLAVSDEWSEAHGHGCIFSIGSGLLELNEGSNAALEDDAVDHPKVGRFDIQFEVADLDSWNTRVDGRWPHSGPQVQPWGERTLRLRDPDGVLVTIYEKTT